VYSNHIKSEIKL